MFCVEVLLLIIGVVVMLSNFLWFFIFDGGWGEFGEVNYVCSFLRIVVG